MFLLCASIIINLIVIIGWFTSSDFIITYFADEAGKPYTLSENNGLNTVFNDQINTGRLPNYNRFDFSSLYNFSFSKKNKLKGKIGLSIRNVFDKNNLISREYIGNNTPNEPINKIDKYSLRRTTNFVFRIEL